MTRVGEPQGRCETTSTQRFANPECSCKTYDGNLGPCKTFLANAETHCVYCDHDLTCHSRVEFACKVCGIACDSAPVDGSGAVCEEHCEDHNYIYDRGLGGHFCKHCCAERPHDWGDD